jgi:hypothetical protein
MVRTGELWPTLVIRADLRMPCYLWINARDAVAAIDKISTEDCYLKLVPLFPVMSVPDFSDGQGSFTIELDTLMR